jgi:hypothetical protein
VNSIQLRLINNRTSFIGGDSFKYECLCIQVAKPRMPFSKKQFWKEVHCMFMIAKTSKILTNSSGVVFKDVFHFINWLPDFLVHLLFLCFYPISFTISNNIPVDQGSFWGSNNYWLQFKEKTNL